MTLIEPVVSSRGAPRARELAPPKPHAPPKAHARFFVPPPSFAPSFWRSALSLLLMGGLMGGLTGCGAGCKRADRAWEEGVRPPSASQGAHWRLEVARGEIDDTLSKATSESPKAPWSLKSPLKGLELPTFSFSLKALSWEVSDRERATLALTIALSAQGEELLTLGLRGDSPIKLDKRKRALTLKVRADQFKRASLKLAPGAKRSLKRAIKRWLPKQVAALIPTSEITKTADFILKKVSDEGYGALRTHLLTPLGQLASLEWGLPKQPIERADLKLTPELWRVDLYTSLSAPGLPTSSPPLKAGELARLSLSAGWVAAAANWAMDQGQLPSEFDTKGKAKKGGPARARLSWAQAKKSAKRAKRVKRAKSVTPSEAEVTRPLKVHFLASRANGAPLCLYARAGVQPSFVLKGSAVKVGAEGAIEQVVGNPIAELAAELTGLGEQTLAWHQRASLPSSFKSPLGELSWGWGEVTLDERALMVSLSLKRGGASKAQKRAQKRVKKRKGAKKRPRS